MAFFVALFNLVPVKSSEIRGAMQTDAVGELRCNGTRRVPATLAQRHAARACYFAKDLSPTASKPGAKRV
jgi:hypothetical protein